MIAHLLERGNLELLSNTLFLSERPIPDYMAALKQGTLPEFLLPVFLHEATHHWCLTSVVGNALAVNDLRIQRAFLDANGVLKGESLTLWSRMSAVRRLFEPLLEGLAQFAEYDAYPGSSAVVSPVLGWAASLFTRSLDIEIPPTMPIERLRYLLCAYRSSEVAMRRKSDILVRPLTTANGGYLLGYLAVKNTWNNALKRSKKLTDADLFLSYLRNTVFEDPFIADIILEPSINPAQAINALWSRLHQRLKLLGSQDLEDRVKQFEHSIAETQTLDGHWDSVYVEEQARKMTTEKLSERLAAPIRALLQPDPSLDAQLEQISRESELPEGTPASQQRERLIERIEKLGGKLALPSKQRERAFIDAAPIVHRTLVRIRVDQVNVQVGADRRCTVSLEGSQLFTTSARNDVPQGEGPGLLALYFLPDYGSLALICVKDDRCVFAIFPENVPKSVQDCDTVIVAQVLLNEKGRSRIPSFIREVHGVQAEGSEDRESFEAQLEQSVTYLYLNHATCFVSDQKLDSCLQLMQANGFWQLLDEDGDRISALASLGLMSSFTPVIAQIEALMRLHAFDLSQILQALEKAQDRFGYHLILTWEKTLRCLV